MADKLLKEAMTGVEIKIELMKKGVKLADIADMAGVTRPTVTMSLNYTEKIRQVLGLQSLRIVKMPGLPKSVICRNFAR